MARCADRVRRVTKGTNAPRPVAISRPGKVTWHTWPATTLRSQWSSQAIAILHLVLVAVVLCRILGSVGVGGRGRSFPPGMPLLNVGPVDPNGSASSGKNSRAVFWGAVRAPGMRGCWGAVPCGASSPPSCCGLTRALCFPALGRPAKSLLLKFCTRVQWHGAETTVLKRLSHGIHRWPAPLAAAKDTGSRQ